VSSASGSLAESDNFIFRRQLGPPPPSPPPMMMMSAPAPGKQMGITRIFRKTSKGFC
jgi:hypothetical protein